jgi:hypothetical protein
MTDSKTDLSILLSRRQKRLQYWKQWLLKESSKIPEVTKNKLKEDLDTFGKILSKYSVIQEKAELEDCEKRLSTMERQFISFFESRRLLTSINGIAAISTNNK